MQRWAGLGGNQLPGAEVSKPGGVWPPPTCVAGAEVAPTGPGSSPGCARARLCAGGWLTSRRAERRGGGGEREQVNGRAPSGSGSGNPGRVRRRCARRRPGRGQRTPHRAGQELAGLPPPPARPRPRRWRCAGGVPAGLGASPAPLPAPGAPTCAGRRRRVLAPARSRGRRFPQSTHTCT